MYELEIHHVDPSLLESIDALLTEQGACAITLMDAANAPVMEPLPGETPLWPTLKIKALFQEALPLLLCKQHLTQQYEGLEIKQHEVQARDWENEWKIEAKPMLFGQCLWVYPSHLKAKKTQNAVVLDPGLAFGTGSHPTTALCLRWLDGQNLQHQTLIDYGCGSGILMIAALKLGAQFAYGVDIDSQALIATKQNATLNDISSDSIHLTEHLSLAGQTVDLVLANILLNPLIELKNHFSQYLKTAGTLAVSGLFIDQVPLLLEAYETDFELISTQKEAQWAMVVFRKKSV